MPTEASMMIRIRDGMDALTPVNARIAAYVLQNPQQVVRMSIRALAQASEASDAAVMRFCKAIGLGSYRELIVGLSAALGAQEDSQAGKFTDIQPGDGLESIIRNISYSNRQSIDDTLLVLDGREVQRAVDLLRGAKRIGFFGIGASALVALDGQQKFSRIGRVCHAHTDSHDQVTAAVLMGAGEVAVVISNSGETREILEALAALRQTRAKIVALTRRQISSLGKAADVVLNFSTPEIAIRSAAMGSRIAMHNLLDILYAGVASQEYSRIARYLERTRGALAQRGK